MPGPHPYGDIFLFHARFDQHFRKPAPRSHFDPLHAEHERSFQTSEVLDFLHKPAHRLRGNGNNRCIGKIKSLFQIARKRNPLIEADVFVFSRLFQHLVRLAALRSPQAHFMPVRCQIPAYKRSPSSASEYGYFHCFLLFRGFPPHALFSVLLRRLSACSARRSHFFRSCFCPRTRGKA